MRPVYGVQILKMMRRHIAPRTFPFAMRLRKPFGNVISRKCLIPKIFQNVAVTIIKMLY